MSKFFHHKPGTPFVQSYRILLIGPNDHNGLTTFWSKTKNEWVERDEATLYTVEEAFSFPPSELPTGGVGMIDITTQQLFTPAHPEGSENN